MLKIVFLDAISIPAAYPVPRPAFAHEWREYPLTKPEEIIVRAKDADIIITNKCKLTAAVLAALPKLKFIAEAATGFNNIDVNYCKEHGIGVSTIQNYSTESVAEHTICMMLMLSRSMIATNRLIADGAWSKSECFCMLPYPVFDLEGRTLSIIGCGAIGSRIAQLAQAFGLKVLKAEHKAAQAVRPGYTPFAEALAAADFISVNCPLNANTNNLIDKPEFDMIKHSAFIINNGRGGIINEAELARQVKSGGIAGYAGDVASVEPLPADHPFNEVVKLPNFILTPHQAWMSDACLKRLVVQLKENMEAWQAGRSLRRVV